MLVSPTVYRCWPLLLLAVLLSALSSPLRVSTSTDRVEATLSHETELNAKLLDLLTPCCSFIASTKSPDKEEKKRAASELLSCVNSSVAAAWQPSTHCEWLANSLCVSLTQPPLLTLFLCVVFICSFSPTLPLDFSLSHSTLYLSESVFFCFYCTT